MDSRRGAWSGRGRGVSGGAARGEAPPLSEVLQSKAFLSDEELAALIRADGRRRLRAGQRTRIAEYLSVIPDLASRPLVLDSAISVALGMGAGDVTQVERAAARERALHPEFAEAIDLAMCLDQLIAPIAPVGVKLAESAEFEAFELGTPLDDGRPRYRATGVIGRGATCLVYAGEDRLFSRAGRTARVAIKVFRRDRFDGAWFDRVLGEAQKARSIEHPNVVRVLDFGFDLDRVFIVQEFVRGRTLDTWIAAPVLPSAMRRFVRVLRDAAWAVDAVHAAGMVHGDMKPQNLLVTDEGAAKVIDFGTAAEVEQAGVRDEGLGTLAYMAPERFVERGRSPAPTMDVYSLGAMLYWGVTGESPNGRSAHEAIAKLSGEPVEASEAARDRIDGAPGTLRRIIERALADRPSDRYSSAGLLAADLGRWLEHRPVDWQHPGVMKRTALTARRHPLAAALALGCAVLLAAGLAMRVQAIEARIAAQETRHVAEIARIRHEAAETWRAASSEQLGRMLMKFKSAKEEGLDAQVLTSLWVLEWVHGPRVLETPESFETIWKARIEVIERLLADFRARGQPDAVEAHMLAPSLALWYILTGRDQDADGLLEPSEAYWGSRTSADDPWLEQIRVLRAVTRVMAAEQRESGGDAGAIERAGEAIETLRRSAASETSAGKSGPIAELVERTLARVDARRVRE